MRALGLLALIAACTGQLGAETETEPEDETPADAAPSRRSDASAPDGLIAPVDTVRPPDALAPARDAPPDPITVGAVVISEIMYHPVLENGPVERHEFVELANRTDAAVSLAGWTLAGDVGFTFPPDTTLPPRGHVAIAKDRQALAAAYAVEPRSLLGNYARELDNGGGRLALADASGTVVDAVTWDDGFPWPLAADGLGGSDDWIPGLASHRYKGRSLERVSLDVPSRELANWAPSPLDGATPGRPNAAAGEVRPVVEALSVARATAAAGPIGDKDGVRIEVAFGARGTVKDPRVEWFVDDLVASGEPRSTQPLVAGAGGLEAMLPPRPANSRVRFRITGDRGAGMTEVISPRPSDPYGWHQYFVSPVVDTKARVHHLFIAPGDWGKMWDTIQGGLVSGCALNPTWNARVPATFVHDGQAYDVQIRYQGGYIHRTHGLTIASWPYPGPTTGPKPLRAMGLKVYFPNWSRYEGVRSITLNKLNQGCPGLEAYLGGELMRAAGVPAAHTRFARVQINGGYYHYMMELESHDQDMIERFYGKGTPGHDYYKSKGTFGDQGPFGPGDERVLNPNCNFSRLERYRHTYNRRDDEWRGYEDLAAMLDALARARAAGGETLRTYLAQSFHVESILSYMAVVNWGGVWDDGIHNHLLYRRADGKWVMTPTDFDQSYGTGTDDGTNKPRQLPTASFYIGEIGNPNNVNGHNLVKDAFLKAYRKEYDQRLLALDASVLKPENVLRILDEGVAAFSLKDWMASPAARACDPASRIERIRQWAPARHAALVQNVKP